MRILIPNSFCFAAIGIVKTLKRLSKYHIIFIGTGEEPYGLASGSKLVDEYFQSPPLENVNEYKIFLTQIIDTHNIDLIFCVLDSDLLVLNEIMESSIHSKTIYITPDKETIQLFQDKLYASKKMQEKGFKIPEIIMEDINCNVILRKNISVGSSGIKKLNLIDLTDFNTERAFLQKHISGDEFTVDVFCDCYGEPALIIPRKRLEIRNGMSFKTQLIYDEKIIEQTQQVCLNFRIPGLWNIQYIKNKDGLFFIELNPRFAGSAIAGIAASFNYLDLYIDHFVYNNPLPSFDSLMSKVAWNSIITRYYEEIVH